MRRPLGRGAFLFAAACSVQFYVLTTLAMALYPGGALYDTSTEGYTFFGNFLSELGITASYEGEPNIPSALVFTLSLSTLGTGLGVFFVAVQQRLRGSPAIRGVARGASVFGIASGLSFIGVAATPADRLLEMHMGFLFVAFPSLVIAATLCSIALFLSGRHLRRHAVTYAGLAAFLACYLTLMAVGPGLNTERGVRFQATAQKIAVYPAIAFFVCQSLRSIRHAPGGRRDPDFGFHAASKIPQKEGNALSDGPAQNSRLIKEKTLEFGADLVGVCRLNRKWLRERNSLDDHRPVEFSSVIVIAVGMEADCFRRPSSPEIREETRRGYKRMKEAAGRLGRYIAGAGYSALAAGNGEAISVPLAVEAGLGRLGRNGMLLTDEFGPRLRIGKVFTDAPLEPDDPPGDLMHDLCRVCVKCAEACPAGAIERESTPSDDVWRVDALLCDRYWRETNRECAACIAVCPLTWRGIPSDKED
jgi:ferredoxin